MPDNFIDLLRRLKDRTSSGDVDWEEAGESMFRAVLDSGMVRIREATTFISVDDVDDLVPKKEYTAWLLTPDARIVREVGFLPDDVGYDAVRDLFDVARRHAMDSDELIGRLLIELERPTARTGDDAGRPGPVARIIASLISGER